MSFSRLGLRASRTPLSSAFRAPARRQLHASAKRPFQQPANSGSTVDKLEGVYDNAFNRERLAVKQHAAATADFWRKLSIYVVVPSLVLVSINTWIQWTEHWEHQAHMPPVSERKQYSYQNIRTKSYPWGDGDKTLFWNDNYNYFSRD